MRERRILFNALSLTEGGGRSYVRNVLRELNRDSRGFAFTVISSAGQISREEAGNLEIVEVGFGDSNSARSTARRVLYEQTRLPFRALDHDLLYCLGDLLPVAPCGPSVVALRNPNIYDHTYYDNVRLRAMETLVRLGVKKAQAVIFPSQAAADMIAPRVSLRPDRIHVVPHGISQAGFESSEAPAEDGSRYLFLPAALERHKNIDTLIRAFARVSDNELELWVAGAGETDPSYAASLRDLALEIGVSERVRFLGPVPYGEISRFYRSSVALVFPSWLETFGHPLLEAMVTGTPILASDIPSSLELASDAALYFSPREPDAIARMIERVLDDPEGARHRVERGRVRAERYSWRRSVDELCSVFETVLRSE